MGYRKRYPFILTLLITIVLLATACGDLRAPASPEPAKPSTAPVATEVGSVVAYPALSSSTSSGLALAKGQDQKFEHISVEHGLSHSTVNCILQDSKGFMWFGTDDGLNRYDGYSFTVYRHNPDDPQSLSHNQVWSLFEDASGVL